MYVFRENTHQQEFGRNVIHGIICTHQNQILCMKRPISNFYKTFPNHPKSAFQLEREHTMEYWLLRAWVQVVSGVPAHPSSVKWNNLVNLVCGKIHAWLDNMHNMSALSENTCENRRSRLVCSTCGKPAAWLVSLCVCCLQCCNYERRISKLPVEQNSPW